MAEEQGRLHPSNPSRATGDLFARTSATSKAVFPTGQSERANPWCVLRDAAIVFCAKRQERPALAPDLMAKVIACSGLVGHEPAQPTRHRADIDG